MQIKVPFRDVLATSCLWRINSMLQRQFCWLGIRGRVIAQGYKELAIKLIEVPAVQAW